MLDALQRLIATVYDVPTGYRVEDFLLGSHASGGTPEQADEQVYVAATADQGLAIGVYLDPQVLDRLHLASPLTALGDKNLADFCTVMEGISHFQYLSWNATHDRGVSRLELELQAEIDKYISGRWLLCRQRRIGHARDLLWQLFDRARVEPSLAGADYPLYAVAHRYAARYCRHLDRRLASDRRAARRAAVAELRRFYRSGSTHKLRHIEHLD
jgi:hypothetical protein